MMVLTDCPALAKAIMSKPWSEGCDEAVILDELRISFLCGGSIAICLQLGATQEELNELLNEGKELLNAKPV